MKYILFCIAIGGRWGFKAVSIISSHIHLFVTDMMNDTMKMKGLDVD